MAKDYEPGTMAIATVRGVPNVRVMRGDGIFENKWYSNRPVTGSLTSFTDIEVTDVRPLVALDPDNRKQVKRLSDVLNSHGLAFCNVDDVTKALRSLVTPPKPAEPTGLGAVVEDAEGDLWIRSSTSGLDAWRREGPCGSIRQTWFVWAKVNAVRVLSEGVPA